MIALALAREAVEAGIAFRALVADCLYGEDLDLRADLQQLGCGYVLALRPSHAWWHRVDQPGSVEELARSHPWQAKAPGDWVPILWRFRDGHRDTWWALEAEGGPCGVDQAERLIIVTTDPATLPELTTWYLVTNLPAPGSCRAEEDSGHVTDLAAVVHL